MELTLGKGGSRDTLTTTAKGQTVYALVPSYNDPVAAFDIHFTTSRSLDGGRTQNRLDGLFDFSQPAPGNLKPLILDPRTGEPQASRHHGG